MRYLSEWIESKANRELLFKLLVICPLAGALSSCKAIKQTSSTKTVNGIERHPERLKAVVKVTLKNPDSSLTSCTATFVSPTTIFFAAHCIDNRKVSYNGIDAKFTKDLKTHSVGAMDFAIAVFPKAVAPAWIPVMRNMPKVNDRVVIAGFGRNDFDQPDKVSTFHFGTNYIRALRDNDELIHIEGETNDKLKGKEGLLSSSYYGDSGGPLIFEGKLIGVVSGGARLTPTSAYSIYPSLATATKKALIDEAIREGADVRFDGEGSIPYKECFDVDSQKAENVYKFDVPHTRVLSVEGKWNSCDCVECLETDANGFNAGPLAEFRPKDSNVKAGSLISWGKKTGVDSDNVLTKGIAMVNGELRLEDISFGVKMQMHSANYAKNKGKLKVCFI